MMRVLKQFLFCVALAFGFTSFASAATYTVTQLPSDFRFRNNNGAEVHSTNVVVSASHTAHSTVTVTDRDGNVVTQFMSPELSIDQPESFSDTQVVVGERFFFRFDTKGTPIVTAIHAFVFANGTYTDLHNLL